MEAKEIRAQTLNSKLGKFKVTLAVIDLSPDYVMMAMQNMVVVDLEYLPIFETNVYTAICEEFDVVKEFEEIPYYHIKLRSVNGQEIRTIERLKGDGYCEKII